MADTNRVLVGLAKEVTYGVTPANPVFYTQRVTSAGAAPRLNSVQSREIRSDRQILSLINTTVDATGAIATEVAAEAQDSLWESTLCGAFDPQPFTGVSAVASTSVTLTSAAGASYPKGSIVKGDNFAVAANNGYFVLTAAGSGSTLAITGGTTETAPAGAVVRLVGIQCATGDCAAAVSPPRITISATTGDFTAFTHLAVGDWVWVGGAASANQFASSGCNGPCRVIGITATTLTFDRVPNFFVADNGAGKQIRIELSDDLINSTQVVSYTQKRHFQDIGAYEYSRGMMVDRATWGGQSGEVMTATFNMEGASGAVQTTAISGESDQPNNSNTPFNLNANVGMFGIGSEDNTGPNYSTQVTFNVANNVRKRIPIGYTGATSAGLGEFNLTLTLSTYFGDTTLYQAVLSGGETSFHMYARADTGGAMIWDVPRIRASSGTPTVEGINQDAMLPITYQALRHAGLGYTIKISRFHGVI